MNDMARIPPNLLDCADAALRELRSDGLALVLDFDGTLSEFVPVLENAVIHPDAVLPLRSLAARTAAYCRNVRGALRVMWRGA